jgi:hypothetical protein
MYAVSAYDIPRPWQRWLIHDLIPPFTLDICTARLGRALLRSHLHRLK